MWMAYNSPYIYMFWKSDEIGISSWNSKAIVMFIPPPHINGPKYTSKYVVSSPFMAILWRYYGFWWLFSMKGAVDDLVAIGTSSRLKIPVRLIYEGIYLTNIM
jgi:hypothetical protein